MDQPEEKFQDVREIHTAYRADEANQHLKLGWRLLRVLTKRDDQDYAEYVLGWYKEGDPAHPSSAYDNLTEENAI
jgi:hypothetical protein